MFFFFKIILKQKVYNDKNDIKVEILILGIMFIFITVVRIITGFLGLYTSIKRRFYFVFFGFFKYLYAFDAIFGLIATI